MAMKIRLARGGSKKRPFYRVVAADSRMPRDGRYFEKLGTYNPLLAKDSEDRVQLNMERVNYWLGQGAQPTERVVRFLEVAGVMKKTERNNPIKAKPGKKAQDRLEEKAAAKEAAAEADEAAKVAAAEAEEAAKAAAAEAAAAPVEEEAAEEPAAEEVVAETSEENAAE
ncbi:30S ribosomal protein S16 [Amylibacter sp.]|nr:30S ribosomal protein S16 [Amylibacter sp.]